MLSADAYVWPLAVVCGAAVVLLAFALSLGLPSLIPWSLVLLAGAYTAMLADSRLDTWSPVYAGAFFAVAELAYWSLELRGRAQEVERLLERRAGLILALAIGSVALGGFLLAATSLQLGSGISVDIVGACAAVTAIALLALVARPRASRDPGSSSPSRLD